MTLAAFVVHMDNAGVTAQVPDTVELDGHAGRKRGGGPVTLRCECTPPRSILASTGTALGPNITCEVCGKPFRISPGQRIGKADRGQPTRPVPVPVTGTTGR